MRFDENSSYIAPAEIFVSCDGPMAQCLSKMADTLAISFMDLNDCTHVFFYRRSSNFVDRSLPGVCCSLNQCARRHRRKTYRCSREQFCKILPTEKKKSRKQQMRPEQGVPRSLVPLKIVHTPPPPLDAHYI